MGMKRPRMSAKDSAPLYAALMVEEYRRRSYFRVTAGVNLGPGWLGKTLIDTSYLHFLRSQRDTHPAYAMAIRQIEGKP